VPATPAFDRDGNANDFSPSELTAINQIWQRVSEKYSPFNINVTTVDTKVLVDRVTLSIVIGGEGAWLGAPAGGVAPLGGFWNGAPNVGFVFAGLPGFDDQGIAEATRARGGSPLRAPASQHVPAGRNEGSGIRSPAIRSSRRSWASATIPSAGFGTWDPVPPARTPSRTISRS
jgi:hypothetical protein